MDNGRREVTLELFIVNMSTHQIERSFKPETGFGNPHGIAISQDGNQIFVVETSLPYKMRKFSNELAKIVKEKTEYLEHQALSQQNTIVPNIDDVPESINLDEIKNKLSEIDFTMPEVDDSMTESLTIMAFVSILLVIILCGIWLFIRLQNKRMAIAK